MLDCPKKTHDTNWSTRATKMTQWPKRSNIKGLSANWLKTQASARNLVGQV